MSSPRVTWVTGKPPGLPLHFGRRSHLPSFHEVSIPKGSVCGGPRGSLVLRTCTLSEDAICPVSRSSWLVHHPVPRAARATTPRWEEGPPGREEELGCEGRHYPGPKGRSLHLPFIPLETSTIRASFEANIAVALDCQLPGLPGSPPTPACLVFILERCPTREGVCHRRPQHC